MAETRGLLMTRKLLLVSMIGGELTIPTQAAEDARVDAEMYAGWQTVRALDCARCHGANFEGQVGPSLVESARSRDAETFKNIILNGNIQNGMPPYKSNDRVVKNLDGIHAYFKALADGKIKPGRLEDPGRAAER
jgi:mono/diheme cytochrome c family protein